MVYNKGNRPRNGGGVRDARDVLRNKGGRRSGGARGSGVGTAVNTKRIIKTSSGLVTNKKPKGISTSQLPHRQRDQKARLPVTSHRANPRPPPRSGENLTATLRRSAIINSSPVLQSILCYLMPMDLTVGARPNIDDEEDALVQTGSGLTVPPEVDTKTSKTPQKDLNRNEAADAVDHTNDEIHRLEHSLVDLVEVQTEQDEEYNQNESVSPSAEEDRNEVVVKIDRPSDPSTESIGNLPSKEDTEDEFELPKTCKVLKAPNGSLVYVVGSAHFSRESQEDVRRVIRNVRPTSVMIELCRQRAHTLFLDESLLLRESTNISLRTIRDTISKRGTMQGGMQILLLQLTAHIASKLKMAPGGEFRVAYLEAKRLGNCQVFLGDRQINITLKRAWASLGIWQRISVISTLLFFKDDISAEDVEKCKDKDSLEQLLGELGSRYPDLMRVLIDERDRYLCRALFNICMTSPEPMTVVAVVGIGHQKGIVDHWERAREIDLKGLSVVPPPSLGVRITNKALYVGMWVGIGFVAYKLTPRSLRAAVASGVSHGLRYGSEKFSSMLK